MGNLIELRRQQTSTRINELREALRQAEILCEGKACVYATGSFARGEATTHSDLDLFIVGQSTSDEKVVRKPRLSRLDDMLVRAELISATRLLKIPDFSGDGEYLVHYTVEDLIGALGKPEDDANNTFTARLLLLLESCPLLEPTVYKALTEDVVIAYWQDFEKHSSDFMPAFLANDILRLWRTFCVNYEANTLREPIEEKAKKKLKNYKLKHSRLLTCYSALLYLLAVHKLKNTVSPTDATNMIQLTPTGRLEWLLAQADLREAHDDIQNLLNAYSSFLSDTDATKKELLERFQDRETSKRYFEAANGFGDLVFKVLETIGQKKRFHRLLVI